MILPIDQAAIARTRLDGLTPQAIRHVVATADALELGRVDEAERHITGAMALFPDHPEVLRLLAGIQNLRGDKRAAIDSMRRAVAQRPDDALYHNTLGAVLGESTEMDAAIASLRRACELQPDLASAWYNLGLLLMRCVRPEESAAALRQAVAHAPDHANARVMLGEMLRASGNNSEAAAEYRQVIAQKPDAGTAWWGLADLKTTKLDDADVTSIRQAMQRPGAGDDDLIAMGFALAKGLEDQGRYAESLAALAQAHARARARRGWNAAWSSGQVDAMLQAFTPPPVAAPQSLGGQVIFITSLPRSGSTLVEQILASHSQVEGAGELPDMPQVLNEESQRRQQPFPQWVGSMTPKDWERLGHRYLERTAHWQNRRPRFTDKLPNNWQYIGVVRAMLPAAHIIVCRRDPLETCLGCYRQFLARNEYTHTFPDLAAYWRDFDRATRHWHALHPRHVYENVYENLVAAPETRIRELLAFCDLDFESGCLQFHKTKREVYSPSASQVREPIRRDTARSGAYGALLDPLRKELGLPPFADADSRATAAPNGRTVRAPNLAETAQVLVAEFTAATARSGVNPATSMLMDRLQAQPHAAGTWTQVVVDLVRGGFHPVAIAVADAAMQHFPQVAQLRYWRANALRLTGRRDEAEQGFRALLHHHPEHRDAAMSLAFMLREQGRLDAAAQVVVALAGAIVGDAEQSLALLAFLRECGAHAQAIGIAAAAHERWPEDARLAAITGEIALALGQFDFARDALHDALARDPGQAAAWLRLAHCQRYTNRNDPDLQRFKDAGANPALAASARICAGFALGKALDDLGDYAAAVPVLRDANTQAHAGTPWRADAWRNFVSGKLATNTLPTLTDPMDFTPVFIIGLPRTGTTLTAALLGGHPQLHDRGELNWIGAMHTNLQTQGQMHEASALRAVRDLVSVQFRRDDAPARGYIDKNPLNFRYLDLIAALFPSARIIHCRRNRRDTALSIWMQHFAHADSGFAYDFADIAAMATGYEQLMAHWRQTLALPIFELDYETLASGDPGCLRRLAQFLEVAPEPLLQAQPGVSGPVTTASVWQVRQPLHTRSIGRWRGYAPLLPELTRLFAED
ncbi:MAG: sulfotransferase [Rudaea sp.]|nr:sulfotransferase [Rudaea sp.]